MFYIRTYLLIIGLCILQGCKEKNELRALSWGVDPGIPKAQIKDNELIIENNDLNVVWELKDKVVHLKKITNKYDSSRVNLEAITLFSIETADGKKLDNSDFKLRGALSIKDIVATDSLPTKALRYKGKSVEGDFISKDGDLAIKWSAQLREGSNYVKQHIELRSLSKNIAIRKVTFFDGKLPGAIYAGSVLGSPITYKNFFFGMEHPIAHSKALMARSIGSVTQKNIDVSEIINGPGEYMVAVEHGGGSDDFNINKISLLKGGEVISERSQLLNGHNGSSMYSLMLKEYDNQSTYNIKVDLVNREKATGTLHLFKKVDGILNFYVNREDVLVPGESISEWSVIGVAPNGQQRRSFLYYLERERARPYEQFLHYNNWWDITDDGASSFTSEQLIERVTAWNNKFIEPFDIKLDAFVFDDGWDDLDRVWYFDPIKFPDGFAKEANLSSKYNSGIGVWMSPFGGYLENKRRRVESGKREGLETNDMGLSLAGHNYFNRFYERSLDMVTNYNVKYFKYDGFGGSEPKYLPDMEAGAKLISKLRKADPDLYFNITVGSWPSPFWLKFADCTWRGSGDLHNAGQGNGSQKFMTYRDGTLYNNIVRRAPYYPLNSIMTVGIAYANLGHPSRFITENESDFKDMVRSSFASGSSLQELYISHDKMKPEFWPILAEAAKWADDNEEVLVDTHWIGGSPINLEVYGMACWKPGKGILFLRNPSNQTVEYELDLNQIFELPKKYKGTFHLKSPWKEDMDMEELTIDSNLVYKIALKPFEVLVLETL
ncbi:hypothetical protein [Arenibacter certesii]|uniref:Enterotoxin n=1 Tax=Arenibacter certesii TaxID=228955 RepID=A0A918J6N4_9FLAO|nr:hypothetical protein [Arenibacter certesii]GGW50504.1 hypothetical protein GCM10007383_37890 [Arenibacter certesii]